MIRIELPMPPAHRFPQMSLRRPCSVNLRPNNSLSIASLLVAKAETHYVVELCVRLGEKKLNVQKICSVLFGSGRCKRPGYAMNFVDELTKARVDVKQ